MGLTKNSIDFTKAYLTSEIGPYSGPVPGAYYQVSVRAYSTTGYASSADGVSAFEQLVPGTVGDIQNITISGNSLSWDAYPGAQRYYIIYGNAGCFTTGTSVDLKEKMDKQGMANGTYTVKIEAMDTNDGARGAQAISSLTVGPDYNYTGNGPLADPANLTWDGFTARWDAVEHADSYKVTVRRKSDDMVFVDTVTYTNQYKVGGEPILGESYQFTVTAQSGHGYSRSATVTSAWKFIPMKYAVQLNACEHGSISVENTMAEEGELVTVTARPDEGYYFVEMSVDGSPVVGNSFVMPAKAVEVSAVFAPYTEIDAVECTVIEPADGEMPSKAITVPAGAPYTAVVTSITHGGAEYLEPFVGGENYYYSVEFIAHPGYGFIAALPVNINGRDCGTYSGSVTERNASYQFRAEYAPLTGTISVSGGTPRFGSTLTASWSGSEDVQFSWYLDGERISGNSTSFPITYNHNIGKTLEVAATALGFSGEVRKVLGVVGKADAPAAPSLTYTKPSSAGASDATIYTTSAMEWSTDRLVWTPCTGELTDLDAGTYYVRYASTENTMAGAHAAVSIPDGNGLIIAAQAYVEQPVVGEDTSIVVTAGDITYTVSSDSVNDYPSSKLFSNITFTAADGYQFDSETVFTLNGETITMTSRFENIANGFVYLNKIKKPLTGTVNVSGTGEYDTYLTADFSGNNVNDPVYTWYVDGVETSYSKYYSSFNVRAEDIGHEITVRVSDPARDGYIESAPISGRKAAGPTGDLGIIVERKPSAYGAADGEFLFGNFCWGGYEYSTDGASWTSIPDGDSYLYDMATGTYYFRKAADELYEAGKITVVIMPEADKLISMASCTIVEPVDGGTPALTVTVPGGANYTVTVNECTENVSPYNPAVTFAATKYYQYELKFTAAPGYKFEYSGENKTIFKVNGKVISSSGGDMKYGSYLLVRPGFTCAYTPLVGTLEIDGFPFFEETMTAKLTDSNAGGTLTYIWYVDGERKDFGVDQDSFVINYREYVGCELSVTVQDSEHSGMLVSPGVMITDPGKTKLPRPTTAAFSAVTMQLTGVDTGMQYRFNTGAWTAIAGTSVDLSALVSGPCTISVKRPGDGLTILDSDSMTISVTKPAPPVIEHTDCSTISNDDGSITGVKTTMEYRASGAPGWTSIASTSVTGLVPGTYQVRVAAAGTALASEPTEIAVKAFNPFSVVRTGTTVSVSVSALPESGTVIVAEYSCGQMIGIWMQDYAAFTPGEAEFTVSSTSTDVKCFLVSASNRPLAAPITI